MATRIVRCMKHMYIYSMRRVPRLLLAAHLLRIVWTAFVRTPYKVAAPEGINHSKPYPATQTHIAQGVLTA
jgi:hypothetical protein